MKKRPTLHLKRPVSAPAEPLEAAGLRAGRLRSIQPSPLEAASLRAGRGASGASDLIGFLKTRTDNDRALRGSRKRLPAMTTIHRPMNILALAVALVAGLLAAPAARAADETPSTVPFEKMAEHYEAIWKALAGDTVDGVAEHARAIAALATKGDHPAEAQGTLPEIADHAGTLIQKAEAADIDSARDAFGELTKPLVRYRKAVGAERLAVAYCPMKKKAWLQPEGDIENPYYGSEMLRCGDFVGR